MEVFPKNTIVMVIKGKEKGTVAQIIRYFPNTDTYMVGILSDESEISVMEVKREAVAFVAKSIEEYVNQKEQ